ncbi:MAG: Asp-tRNA(Asn)/Glu-tRNA(Gln) amidotransferase subunit GatA, partial [Erysipelotrichaceae bacterium]|nr:Asp-tRNA(Asn)/Glu-tRNA(Gln) amidotransferase subunit GatA [Erysipelotrichaceae bacterium]
MRIRNASKAMDAYRRLEELNERCNCVITSIKPDREGIPIALKDNISTKGILTTAACGLLSNYVPVYNAHIVDRLEEKGFVCIAKANMDELSMGGTNISSFHGPCLNAYDQERISGGSSGGSAVLVAGGAVPVAIGTDTGDSVRKPAALNGVVGVKPTYGRISRYGVIPYASSLDHVGYFTTGVEDAAYMLEVLAGRDDRDMTSSFKEVPEYAKLLNSDVRNRKILVMKNVTDTVKNREILQLFYAVIDELKRRGADIKEITFDRSLMKTILPVYYVIANAEAASNHADLNGINYGRRVDGEDYRQLMINTRTAGFGSRIKKRLIIGSYALFEENQDRIFRKARKIRRLIVDEVMSKL